MHGVATMKQVHSNNLLVYQMCYLMTRKNKFPLPVPLMSQEGGGTTGPYDIEEWKYFDYVEGNQLFQRRKI